MSGKGKIGGSLGTIVGINWLNLKRDKIALALTFVLPVVFFSIFASIFGRAGGGGGGGPDAIDLLVVDLDA